MRRKETTLGRQARHEFYRDVLDSGGCYFRNHFPHQCEGPIDPCHLLPKQRLRTIAARREYGEGKTLALIWDHRNGIPGCRAFHHRLDNGFIRLYWDQLPPAAQHFARDWDLVDEMKHVYREDQHD